MMKIDDTLSAGPHKAQLSNSLAQNGWKLIQIVKKSPKN